jgi:hypothetical protein
MKTLKELTKVNMEIEVKDSRLILHYHNQGEKISGQIDVTQLFHFFKEFFDYNKEQMK